MGIEAMIATAEQFGITGGENGILASRPYMNARGEPCITVNTGQLDNTGQPIYKERRINTNATLRDLEWRQLDDEIITAFKERLVVVDDLISGGLTYNAGGLGTIVTEWETASEMTDAEITMDGESASDKDRQEFGLDGVPIPVIHKEFSIGARMLLASRQRGAGLDVTQGQESARSVARRSEAMVFNGANIGASRGRNKYTIPGLTTYENRETFTISDWADDTNVSPEDIHKEILAMVAKLETNQRVYGPFKLYVPGVYASRFREDFKANSDKTLMERVTDEDVIDNVRFSDVLAPGNVVLIQMQRSVIDLAIASDVTTVQWESGSRWTNNFQVFASWAPRIKSDFDGRCGILHGSIS